MSLLPINLLVHSQHKWMQMRAGLRETGCNIGRKLRQEDRKFKACLEYGISSGALSTESRRDSRYSLYLKGVHHCAWLTTIRWLSGKGSLCSCRGPGFDSQHSLRSSQPHVTPVRGNDTLFWLRRYCMDMVHDKQVKHSSAVNVLFRNRYTPSLEHIRIY